MALELRDGMWFDGEYFLVDWDDATRRAVFVKDCGDEWEVRTDYYAMDELVDHNADFRNADSGKKMGDWVRVASVPQYILDQHNIDDKLRQGDKHALSRFFNDADFRKFRTREGKF